ncbi:hypothetical protein VP01_11177g1 [Puccinia sorghi]|uniref:Uncharacterized protein n=1 Tax=Puccinia sorghi TaxID=27349 RepID=A0A0L6VSH1_9BASI|nr:hypothetical protein VP01_11177g1 [Puccinia sorghi]
MPYLIQLQKNIQETLSELPILPDEMELFDIIKCSSETEVISKKKISSYNPCIGAPLNPESSPVSLTKSTSPKCSPCKDHNMSKLSTFKISRNLLTPPLPPLQ